MRCKVSPHRPLKGIVYRVILTSTTPRASVGDVLSSQSVLRSSTKQRFLRLSSTATRRSVRWRLLRLGAARCGSVRLGAARHRSLRTAVVSPGPIISSYTIVSTLVPYQFPYLNCHMDSQHDFPQ